MGAVEISALRRARSALWNARRGNHLGLRKHGETSGPPALSLFILSPSLLPSCSPSSSLCTLLSCTSSSRRRLPYSLPTRPSSSVTLLPFVLLGFPAPFLRRHPYSSRDPARTITFAFITPMISLALSSASMPCATSLSTDSLLALVSVFFLPALLAPCLHRSVPFFAVYSPLLLSLRLSFCPRLSSALSLPATAGFWRIRDRELEELNGPGISLRAGLDRFGRKPVDKCSVPPFVLTLTCLSPLSYFSVCSFARAASLT